MADWREFVEVVPELFHTPLCAEEFGCERHSAARHRGNRGDCVTCMGEDPCPDHKPNPEGQS